MDYIFSYNCNVKIVTSQPLALLKMKLNQLIKTTVIRKPHILYLILVLAILMRLYFRFGHVFSDDAYYDFLSYTLFNSEFTKDFLGAPVFPLRINIYLLTAFAYYVFGTNELAAMFFPMLFSLCNILLTYHLAKLITKSESIALIAAFLMALLPTDVAFATINFVDSAAAFFINIGIYFLYRAYKQESLVSSIIGGIFLAFSIYFKINVFYISILLVILFLFDWRKGGAFNRDIFLALSIIGLSLFIEAIVYYNLYDNFFYRFHQTEINYLYGKNDFFTKGSSFGYASSKDYLPQLLKLIFIYNPKVVFLRRFHLFLPILALIQSIMLFRKKQFLLIVFWFLGLTTLFIFFTTSFQAYRPQVLRFSWYIFPLFMPAVILSAMFLSKIKVKIRVGLIILYFIGSLIMCNVYKDYFNLEEMNKFKEVIRNYPEKLIFTDHYSKYSVDLLDDYNQPLRTRRILGKNFQWNNIQPGDWIIYHEKHIQELESQNHSFPDFNIIKKPNYKRLFQIGYFEIYEKSSD